MMRIGTARRAWLGVAVLLGLLGSSAPRARAVVSVDVGSATGVPGGTAQFLVTLSTGGAQVAGTLNSVSFDPATPIVACTTNPGLTLSECALEPQDCTPGADCQFVRCFIGQLSSPPPPIRDGTVLYFCTVDIASNADVTSYPLTCSDASAADVNNKTLEVQCTDGQVQVVPILVAAAAMNATTLTLKTAASTGFPRAGTIIQIDGTSSLSIGYTLGSDNTTLTLSSPLPVDVPDNTQITVLPLPTPTPTATVTPTPTATPAPGGGGGGGGCKIASVCQSYTGLLLMMPAVWLWLRRRR